MLFTSQDSYLDLFLYNAIDRVYFVSIVAQ